MKTSRNKAYTKNVKLRIPQLSVRELFRNERKNAPQARASSTLEHQTPAVVEALHAVSIVWGDFEAEFVLWRRPHRDVKLRGRVCAVEESPQGYRLLGRGTTP